MPEAAEQLCLDVNVAELEAAPEPEIDLAEAFLAAHHGDVKAAIRELLLDADHLRDQLFTASMLMSHGMSRGWRPRYERV